MLLQNNVINICVLIKSRFKIKGIFVSHNIKYEDNKRNTLSFKQQVLYFITILFVFNNFNFSVFVFKKTM